MIPSALGWFICFCYEYYYLFSFMIPLSSQFLMYGFFGLFGCFWQGDQKVLFSFSLHVAWKGITVLLTLYPRF